MKRLKLVAVAFCGVSLLSSNSILAMPTYTNDYVETTDMTFGDFKFSVPTNWEEFDNDETYHAFAILDDKGDMKGHLGVLKIKTDWNKNFEYPDFVLEKDLSETFSWPKAVEFEKYPILGGTEYGYFGYSEATINDILYNSYVLSFPYNGFCYYFNVNIQSETVEDYSFDIAHIFNSICYADKAEENSSDNDSDIGYGPGQYKVGTDIPASEYYVLTRYDGANGYFSVTSDSNGDNIIINDLFPVNSIVSVNEGEYLTLDNASAIPSSLFNMATTIDYTSNTSGVLKVGYDIQPGEYKLTATNSSGYWAIYSDARHNIVSNNIFDSSCYVTLSDGQYFNYSDCAISQ